MKTCDVWGLARLLSFIEESQLAVKSWVESEDRDSLVPPDALKLYVEDVIHMAAYHAQQLELQSTHDRVWIGGGCFYLISTHLTWQQLANELAVLRQCIEADLEKHKFIQLPSEKVAFLVRWEREWEVIWTAIPAAKEDIGEATECYVLDRNTASVFHSMRVVEWGLRGFCVHLGFKDVKVGKRDGKELLNPVEFATWDRILNQLRPHAQTKIDRIKSRAKKQAAQEFYFSALAELEGFKDAWRNHVMHTRRSYSAEDAVAVLTHVQRFMKLLVTNGVGRQVSA